MYRYLTSDNVLHALIYKTNTKLKRPTLPLSPEQIWLLSKVGDPEIVGISCINLIVIGMGK